MPKTYPEPKVYVLVDEPWSIQHLGNSCWTSCFVVLGIISLGLAVVIRQWLLPEAPVVMSTDFSETGLVHAGSMLFGMALLMTIRPEDPYRER